MKAKSREASRRHYQKLREDPERYARYLQKRRLKQMRKTAKRKWRRHMQREREREGVSKRIFFSFLFSLSTKHSNASSNLGMERPLRRKMCIIMSAKIFVPKEKMNRWLLLCRILWIQKCSPNICALVSDAWSIQKPVSDITSVIYTRTGREWILASKMWLRSTGKTIGMRYKNNNKKEKKKKKKENAFTGQYQTT